MLERPPKETARRSWGYAMLWAGLIFATIPFVPVAVAQVRAGWGSDVFTYGVASVVALVAAGVTCRAWKRLTLPSLAWIVGLCALVVYLTFDLSDGSPEEAIHYVQYGTLSVLLFRGFAHRIRDYSIYAAATVAGSLVGMVDETIQWLTPGRTFDLRDVWLNFSAVAMVQLGIALGIRPQFISAWPGWASLRRVSYLAAAAVAYLGLCLQNTPDRIAWYSERVPFLGFIDPNRNIMVEYGYLHGDETPMQFRSRLSRQELRRETVERAEEGARILDRYHHERYGEFLTTYSPLRDPFLHEARVHLFRRDVHLLRARLDEDEEARARGFATAYWENRILAAHFGDVLRASNYQWSHELEDEVRSKASIGRPYDSWVSRHLLVGASRGQLAVVFLLTPLGLLAIGYYSGRRAICTAPDGPGRSINHPARRRRRHQEQRRNVLQ